jgi:DNA-binding CsgD family transcriptional regulator
VGPQPQLDQLSGERRAEAELVLRWVSARTRIRELREELQQTQIEEATLRAAVMRLHGDTYPGLSRRERDVLQQIHLHKTNKEIGAALNIAERTAKFHVSSLLRKFKVSNRVELVAKLATFGDGAPEILPSSGAAADVAGAGGAAARPRGEC